MWLETNAPVYYTNTVEVLKPYGQLSLDIATISVKKMGALYGNMKEYVVEKTPVVVATVEQYAPGVVDTVQSYAASGYSVVKKYSNEYYQITVNYLSTKVFV